MLKVGLITIPDYKNYGNRLQNYALQEAIKMVNYDAISYIPYRPSYLKTLIATIIGKGYDGTLLEKKRKLKRLKNFLKFDKNYANTKVIGSKNYPPRLEKESHFFIAGSDQIRNRNWYKGYAFLDFVHTKKKFSYAVSFGCDDIPQELIDVYKSYMCSFDLITVREKTGKQIVKDILGVDVEVVPDPTFALTANEWIDVAHKPEIQLDKEYVLLYFLGGMDNNLQLQINKICEEKIRYCVNLQDFSSDDASECGPSEFIYLINHASLVLTDSYHACVFSILFHKQFVVFDRVDNGKKMKNRIETLLERFQLGDCMYSKNYVKKAVDYTGKDIICDLEREKVLNTLGFMVKYAEVT